MLFAATRRWCTLKRTKMAATNPRSAGLSVRRALPDDKPRIIATLAEYLPTLDAEQRWRWLYETNPHGRAMTWLAIEDKSGEVAGITSFFARRLIVDGEIVAGALGGDGYVRPAFRRRGLGERMHAASRADMPALGLEIMFGTPMPANLTPLTKAGARSIAETVRYVRLLDARALGLSRPWGRNLLRLASLRQRTARLEPMQPNDPRVDEAWQRTVGELRIATVRDAAFYTWRFLQSPSQQQRGYVVLDGARVLGACALERMGDRLRIVDLVVPRGDLGATFDAIEHAFPDVVGLELKLTDAHGRALGIHRHGFFARGEKPLNLLLPPGEPRAAVYYDPTRWYFSWADSDMDQA